MRYGLVIFIITSLFAYNTLYDQKLTTLIKTNMKYIKTTSILFTGLSLYLFIRKHPFQSKNLLSYAADVVRYIPIDRESKDLITPLFDLTNDHSFASSIPASSRMHHGATTPYNVPIVKRSVSESRKKFVASNQHWKCNHCNQLLDATFEIDHVMELQHGGTNDVNNLVALCRNCHGKKSLQSKL